MSGELDASFGSADSSPESEPVVELAPEETLGSQFLNNIPEQDRQIVAKYVKDWDSGVTKKFQSIHDQYKPYKELGDLETIQKAYNFYSNFSTNGEQVFAQMFKGYLDHYGEEALPKLAEALGMSYDPNGSEEEEWDYSQGEPDEDEVFRQNVMSELDEIREFREQQEQAMQEAEAAEQLDGFLEFMQNEHQHIPQQYVVQQIAAGVFDPQTIVSNYDSLAQSIGSQRARPNPPIVMGAGQGGVPSGQVDASKLDSKGRKSLIEQFLAAQQE